MKKVTQILIIVFIGVVTVSTAKAQTYDPLAVQRINDLIAKNGLDAKPDEPETWTFVEWNNESPKQIIELQISRKNLKGSASFAELTTLQLLVCTNNYLTELDLTNCMQLRDLGCYTNNLSELDLTSCKQLKILACGANQLAKLDITSCKQLEYLHCARNMLAELDLTGLDKLLWYEFEGEGQNVSLILCKNETGEYANTISLNNPTFENSAISYSDGILKSKDKSVISTSFIAQTNKNLFELSGTMNFIYSDVGINEIDNSKLKVYPNPNTGELVIENGKLKIENITIVDMEGKTVLFSTVSPMFQKHTLDISHLQVGIYFVKFFTEEGNIVKKIVKQ